MADLPKNPRHSVRWYAPHHFVLLPLAAVLLLYAGRRYFDVAGTDTAGARLWFTLAALALALLATLVLLRQHYALGLQDRLIRLEVRQRYFELTGRTFRALENRLTMKQIMALRFASDEQLPALAEEAATQNTAPASIIARIGDGYQADPLRL